MANSPHSDGFWAMTGICSTPRTAVGSRIRRPHSAEGIGQNGETKYVDVSLPDQGALGLSVSRQSPIRVLRRLVEQGSAVILLALEGDVAVPKTEGIWTLINYLAGIRFRARMLEGRGFVNFGRSVPH